PDRPRRSASEMKADRVLPVHQNPSREGPIRRGWLTRDRKVPQWRGIGERVRSGRMRGSRCLVSSSRDARAAPRQHALDVCPRSEDHVTDFGTVTGRMDVMIQWGEQLGNFLAGLPGLVTPHKFAMSKDDDREREGRTKRRKSCLSPRIAPKLP